MSTPILVVAYKRPETTRQVMDVIYRLKPPKLYVSLNIPRPNADQQEIENCRIVESLFSNLPWDCDVVLNKWKEYRSAGASIGGAISWVFEHEETAIVLEDDCVPDQSFFRYCDEILEKYKDDERVMLVSGMNHNTVWDTGGYSYCFAKYGAIHGWATWRRAWQKVDLDLKLWEDPRTRQLIRGKLGGWHYYYLNKVYARLANQSKNAYTWDYQFDFARYVNNGLAIVPAGNLVTNVGYGVNATHTKNKNARTANLELVPMAFPLKHPPVVIEDTNYDRLVMSILFPKSLRIFLSIVKQEILRRLRS